MPNKKIKHSSKTGSRPGGEHRSQTLDLLDVAKQAHDLSAKLNPVRDLKALANSDRTAIHSILFGRPHTLAAGRSTGNPASTLGNLLTSAGKQSVNKLFGEGLFSFGLTSLFSSVSDLFSGSSNVPTPLQQFSLPSSQQESFYSSAGVLSATNTNFGPASNGSSALYGASSSSANQAAIVSAVRNALLTSSSLNDVIGEL